jgi:DHA2 family multidrug resistance protein
VIFGVFMVLLDTTIVNIAIPRLQSAFGAGLTDVDWVAAGYTLAEGIGIPLTPFFATLLGNKRFYLIILTLFTIGSALCGLAWSLTALIVFRIIQGLAGASMLPMSITLLYSEFPPEERGIALGALGFPLLLAPALGPSLGGYMVTFVSWQMLFYINVPVGIVGLIMAAIFLHDIRPERDRPLSFDFVGFLCSTIGLGSLLYALDKVGTLGWGSFTVLSFLLVGFGSLAIFVIVELVIIDRGGQPLLDVRLFRIRSFSGGNIAMLTIIFALYGGQFLVPLYLQSLRGLSAYDAGLVLLPQAIGSMVASLLGGRLVDKIGVKAVVIPGLVVLGVALWGFAHLTLQTPFSTFQFLLIIRGLGIGFAIQPTTVAALAEVKPAQLSQATSINSVVRSMSSALAVASLSTLVTARTTFHVAHLAEQVTPDSPAGQALLQEAGYLTSQGMTPQSAMFVAMGRIAKQVQLQAYLLAMNDGFFITLGIISITVLVVLFIIRSRKKAPISTQGNQQEHVAFAGEHVEEPALSAERVAVTAVSTQGNQQEHVAFAGEHVEEHALSAEQITVTAQEKAPVHERKKDAPMRRLMRRSVIIPAIILAIFLVAGVGGYFVYNSYNFYSTDDAQVTGSMVNIVPPTSGTLTNLSVEVGSQVSARQIIGTVQPTGPLPVQHLIAPMDGVIVQAPSVVGQLVSTTTTVVQEVDPNTVKITAYVDESAIKNITPGQAVDIHVDAYNSTISGHVTQIVGATAGQFSLLPTSDNGSGNYTKVSQRIPVYVQIDSSTGGSLLPGMSVEVTIHLR